MRQLLNNRLLLMFNFTRLCNRYPKKIAYKQVNFCTMQEPTEHVCGQVAMRQKKKLRQMTSINSCVKIQVIGSGARGVSPSILLSTDHICYLFNCGESTQKIANEHHCKLAKIDHIFITRPCWTNVGGLPGLLLTLQETGLLEVRIHCSEKMHDLMSTVKNFISLSKLEIHYPQINEYEPYEDHILKVYYVPLKMSSSIIDESSLKSSDVDQNNSSISGKRSIDNSGTEHFVKEKKLKSMVDVICYICNINPRPGNIAIEKCTELGVPHGPLIKLLKDGKNVTLNDGRVILSKDVCIPSNTKFTFMVVECPTEEYLNSLVNHSAFSIYQDPAEGVEVHSIFHITPEDIYNNPLYQDWINKFSINTKHIILNKENTCMGSEAVYKNQYLLNMIHPEIFPMLSVDSLNESKDLQMGKNTFFRGSTMMSQKLQPRLGNVVEHRVLPTPEQYDQLVSSNFDFKYTLANLKTTINIKTNELKLNAIPEFPQIVMLGTGSSVPNKVRNVSAILLRINETSSILLDCGEGTYGQLLRLYGHSETVNILQTLKAIYISHMHADHHLGIIGLLQEREEVTKKPLYIFAPHTIELWFKYYNNRIEPISHTYTLLNNQNFFLKKLPLNSASNSLFAHLNVKQIYTTFVRHCKYSYGVAIILQDGTKIVYSGDTTPCESLLQLGNNCDLLIHEATMDDGLEEQANLKYHSTTAQAINAGKLMNAKFTLLTHFSQRYSKIPILSESEKNVGLAYDSMVIKLQQLPLLPLFYPCLKLLFNEYYKEVERRSNKQRLKIY